MTDADMRHATVSNSGQKPCGGFMQDICCKLSRTAAVVVVMIAACVGSAWAVTGYKGGVPWQVDDIIVCFGSSGGFGGACNVLRITSNGPVLLDQFSDG